MCILLVCSGSLFGCMQYWHCLSNFVSLWCEYGVPHPLGIIVSVVGDNRALLVSPTHILQADKLVHSWLHHHLQIPSHSLFRHIQLLANVLERSMPGETKPDYSPEESTIFCGIYTISFLQHWNVGHILHQIPQTLSSIKLCRICNWGQHNLLEELWRQNNLARSFLLFLLLSQLLHLTEQYL